MPCRLPFFSNVLALFPFIVNAQMTTPLSEVVVTASRLNASPDTTPYSVSVISSVDLAGRTDVADALNELSEIYVQTPGGRSGAASIFLRGADPNFTVVLFDGVPLNDSTNSRGGAVNVAEIDAASLQRVELVTGPLSSLYGSGSLAGVVNLVAPAGTRMHQLQSIFGAGTHNQWTASARWQGPLTANLGGSLSIAGDDDGEQTPDANFRSHTFTGKIHASTVVVVNRQRHTQQLLATFARFKAAQCGEP